MIDHSLFADRCALVLEDDPAIRARLLDSLSRLGLSATPLASAEAARQLIDESPPDLMVLGREFRGNDNLDLVQSVRLADPAHWIAILMLGNSHEVHGEALARQRGCDDYLLRDFDDEVLRAKLTSLMRMRKLRQFSELQRAELSAFRDRAEHEAELARFLLSRLSRMEQLEAAGVAYHWLPAEGFSGDLLAATRSSTGDLYGMLADATGHGLAAAINLIPLTTAFYAMAAKGFNLLAISEQLNKVVKDYSLPDRFVAVSLARFPAREQRLEVVNAGNPSLMLVSRERRVIREIASGSIPLGILDRAQFRPRVESCELSGGEELLMCSDGLLEACSRAGNAFGRERVLEALARADLAHDGVVLSLRTALAAHCVGVAPTDDVSVMVLSAPDPASPALRPAPPANAADPAPAPSPGAHRGRPDQRCAVEFSFSSAELQRVDVVPVIVDLARSIGLPKVIESRFFTVLSEMFVNALDHGLLGLESRLKAEEDGFERYFALRAERLAGLDIGEIVIRLDHRYLRSGSGRMRVEVSDSGAGFDHERWMRNLANPELGEGAPPSGRGLGLLMTLCDVVQFNERGNSISVEFAYA